MQTSFSTPNSAQNAEFCRNLGSQSQLTLEKTIGDKLAELESALRRFIRRNTVNKDSSIFDLVSQLQTSQLGINQTKLSVSDIMSLLQASNQQLLASLTTKPETGKKVKLKPVLKKEIGSLKSLEEKLTLLIEKIDQKQRADEVNEQVNKQANKQANKPSVNPVSEPVMGSKTSLTKPEEETKPSAEFISSQTAQNHEKYDDFNKPSEPQLTADSPSLKANKATNSTENSNKAKTDQGFTGSEAQKAEKSSALSSPVFTAKELRKLLAELEQNESNKERKHTNKHKYTNSTSHRKNLLQPTFQASNTNSSNFSAHSRSHSGLSDCSTISSFSLASSAPLTPDLDGPNSRPTSVRNSRLGSPIHSLSGSLHTSHDRTHSRALSAAQKVHSKLGKRTPPYPIRPESNHPFTTAFESSGKLNSSKEAKPSKFTPMPQPDFLFPDTKMYTSANVPNLSPLSTPSSTKTHPQSTDYRMPHSGANATPLDRQNRTGTSDIPSASRTSYFAPFKEQQAGYNGQPAPLTAFPLTGTSLNSKEPDFNGLNVPSGQPSFPARFGPLNAPFNSHPSTYEFDTYKDTYKDQFPTQFNPLNGANPSQNGYIQQTNYYPEKTGFNDVPGTYNGERNNYNGFSNTQQPFDPVYSSQNRQNNWFPHPGQNMPSNSVSNPLEGMQTYPVKADPAEEYIQPAKTQSNGPQTTYFCPQPQPVQTVRFEGSNASVPLQKSTQTNPINENNVDNKIQTPVQSAKSTQTPVSSDSRRSQPFNANSATSAHPNPVPQDLDRDSVLSAPSQQPLAPDFDETEPSKDPSHVNLPNSSFQDFDATPTLHSSSIRNSTPNTASFTLSKQRNSPKLTSSPIQPLKPKTGRFHGYKVARTQTEFISNNETPLVPRLAHSTPAVNDVEAFKRKLHPQLASSPPSNIRSAYKPSKYVDDVFVSRQDETENTFARFDSRKQQTPQNMQNMQNTRSQPLKESTNEPTTESVNSIQFEQPGSASLSANNTVPELSPSHISHSSPSSDVAELESFTEPECEQLKAFHESIGNLNKQELEYFAEIYKAGNSAIPQSRALKADLNKLIPKLQSTGLERQTAVHLESLSK